MRDNFQLPNSKPVKRPIPFVDDWPNPPGPIDENSDDPATKDLLKWRMQILLAVNPFGIPSLAFHDAYTRMFRRQLDVKVLGFEHLSEMVYKLKDIFAVQEPDESTGLLFPDYPCDKILHDARLGRNFDRPNMDGGQSLDKCNEDDHDDDDNNDYNDLIHLAWVNRDQDFPKDVVIENLQYDEMFPMKTANVAGTRGLYQGTVVSAAAPDSFYIRFKTNDLKIIKQLSGEILKYFEETECPMDAYTVPKEFLYPGFPCLVYVSEDKLWERCQVLGKTPSNKVLIESVDYGGVYAVNQLRLYLIPRKFFETPRQTLKVKMLGLKPGDGLNWSPSVGSRMRCFSIHNYWLDFLILDRNLDNGSVQSGSLSTIESVSDSSTPPPPSSSSLETANKDTRSELSGADRSASPLAKTKIKKRHSRFEIIVVDRNDTEMDIYLDEILVMETYASLDVRRAEQLKELKQKLREALKETPRPENPFVAK